MADTTGAPAAQEAKTAQMPEWEHIAAKEHGTKQTASQTPRGSTKETLRRKLDTAMPPHRKYIGLRRNVFLIVLLVVFLAILALIIGLAAGLTTGSSQNLPLPSNSDTFEGDLTYYQAGLGACGETNGQDDLIVSISHTVFDAAGSSSSTGGNSNANPLCGRMVRATRYNEEAGAERSVDLKVADRCTGCAPEDLDTTLGAFEMLASEADGRVDVKWAWLEWKRSDSRRSSCCFVEA